MKKLLIVLILIFLFLYQASTAKSIFDFSNDEETPVLSEQSRDSLALIYTDYLKLRQPEVAPTGFTTAFPPLAVNPLYKFAKDSTCFKFEGDRYKEGAELDSSGNYMIMYERLFEEDFNQTTVMNLDDYAKARLTYDDKVIWKKEVAKNTGNEESAGILDELAIDIPFKIKSKTFHRVFGGNKIGLRANGTLSLSMKYNTNYLQNRTYPQGESSGGDVKFEQTQDFSINGKIGTKVDVEIAQSTQKMDFENTMKITYTGESDEIVEKIEAGNISLSLPGTQFATFSGTNKGLYGIKTDLKLGNFKSTFIASLEKGESQEITLPLGVNKQPTKIIEANEYTKMRMLFLDQVYKDTYNNPINFQYRRNLNNEYNILQASPVRINDLRVFVSVNNTVTGYVTAKLLVDGSKPDDISDANVVIKDMPMLELKKDQHFVADANGWIRFTTYTCTDDQYVAVYFSKNNGTTVGYQSPTNNSDLRLQVIGKKSQRTSDDKFFDLEWKNVYSLGASDVLADGFTLNVKKTEGSDLQETYTNEKGEAIPFNKSLDILNDESQLNIKLLNTQYGDFIFPDLQPFHPLSSEAYINKNHLGNTVIYDKTTDKLIYDFNTTNHQSLFKLYFDFTSKSKTTELGFNVLEGSEVVMANSKKLEKDKDYTIDYQSGQLSIIRDEYLSQTITIKYEKASFFQLDQKVLLGNRWQYNFDESSFLGLSLLYYSKSLRDERIHVGYEPINNFVWDLNGLYSFDAPYLTQAADWLPLIQTDKESKIKIEGEIAQIIPNPNPLNKAYIDDFENSERKRSLGINDANWHYASPPDNFFNNYTQVPESLALFNPIIPASLLQNPAVKQYYYKTADIGDTEDSTSFYWYNKKESETSDNLKRPTYAEIYTANVSDELKKQKFNTLNFKFRPRKNEKAFTDAEFNKKWLWNGVMRYLPQGYMQDFKQMKYLEMLVKTKLPGNIEHPIDLYIDLGQLSEDIIPNGKLDEEKPLADNIHVNKDDDIGLDKMKGNNDFYSITDSLKDAPYAFKSFDNFPTGTNLPDVDLYKKNRTEGNELYDTENLKGQGFSPNLTVSAYRYRVKLNQTDNYEGITISTAGLQDGWKLIRIPLNKTLDTLGTAPSFNKIPYIKLWLSGTDQTTDLEFASLDVVGNEWVAADQYKDFIEAKIISTENGSALYSSPTGVSFDKDKENKETSLQVTINSEKRKEVYVTKKIESESYLMYKSLDMHVFGGADKTDDSWSSIDKSWSFFYRIGSDSNNYYQYNTKLYPQKWDENRIVLDIDSLTAIKSKRNNYNALHAGEVIPKIFTTILSEDGNKRKRYLSIVGNPSLQTVTYFAAGVMDSSYTPATAKSVSTGFLLNDITVKNVRKNNALAMRAAVSMNFADLATVSAGVTKKDADFHTVSEKSSSGNPSQSLNYDISTSVNIDKLFPSRWGVSLPVSYSYANSYSHTKYEGNSDILVDEKSIPDSVKTKQISEAFTYSIKKSSKSDDPLLKYTIDNLSYSGTSNLTEGSNTTSKLTESESYSNNLSYALNLPVSWFSLPIFSWTKDIEYLRHLSSENFNFFPNNYSVALSANQGRTKTVSRKDLVTQNSSFTVARTFNTSISPFSILKSDYSLTLNSDMYKQRRNLLDTTLTQSPNPGVAGNSGYVDLDNPVNPVVFTHRPGLRGYDRFFMLDFGELDTWKSSFNTSLQFDLTKWTAYSFSHNTSYNWNGNLSSSNGRTLSNSYSVAASTRLKSKEIFQSLDATYQEWFPAKETPLIQATDSLKINEVIPKLGDADIPVRGGRGAVVLPEKQAINFEVLKYFKESLNDISLTFGTNRSANLIKGYGFDQADLEFQLGFSRIPHNYTEGTMNWTGGFDWKIQTGLNLVKNLSLSNLSYTFKRSYNDDNVDLNGSDSKTQFILPPFLISKEDHEKTNIYDGFCLPLPDYGISYTGLKDLLRVDDIFTGIDLTHSKSSSRSEVWYLKNSRSYTLNSLNIPEYNSSDSSKFIIKSKKYNLNFSPALGIKMAFKNQMNLDASVDYSFDLDEGYLNRKANSGSKKMNITYKTSAGYNQKGGFQTPFNFWPFSGKKMDNDIVYSFGASYGITRTYNATLKNNVYTYEAIGDGSETIIASLSPKITYQLAKNINGSFSYSYSRRETKTVGNTDPEISADHIMDLTFTMKIVSK